MRQYVSFYFDAFKLAIQSIFAHKLRAFLTLIGNIIGVASVVVVGASINGFNTYVMAAVSKMLGVNHFMMARTAFNGRMSQEQWSGWSVATSGFIGRITNTSNKTASFVQSSARK